MQLSSSLSLCDITSDVNDTEFAGIIISSGFETGELPLGRWLPGDGERIIILLLLILLMDIGITTQQQATPTTTTTTTSSVFVSKKSNGVILGQQ